MARVDEKFLIRAIEFFERGWTWQRVADNLGVTHRWLYRMRDKSIRQYPQFWLLYTDGQPGYWHEHIERARARSRYETHPCLDDWTDWEMKEVLGLYPSERFLYDADGNRIPKAIEEEPPNFDDIEELEAAAREPPRHPKPQGAVSINRTSSNDPPERLTGAPEQLSTAERERRHPRAHLSVNADLKPAWAKPRPTFIPIDSAEGTGDQELPDDMRMTVATQRLNYAERVHHGPMRVWDGSK